VAAHYPEGLLDQAIEALSASADWRGVVDQLPAPIYITDPEGAVTYWNKACVDFAGRVPQLGEDRWCVTWQLYTTTGEFLPHDECPMAEAVKTRQQVREKIAIALRPDGHRVAFRAYPTPLFDSDGEFTGAINMLIDISAEQVDSLNDQAERCRRLAGVTFNREISTMLDEMAADYERTAEELARTGA
jgi:PAS domain S-box-containing protein